MLLSRVKLPLTSTSTSISPRGQKSLQLVFVLLFLLSSASEDWLAQCIATVRLCCNMLQISLCNKMILFRFGRVYLYHIFALVCSTEHATDMTSHISGEYLQLSQNRVCLFLDTTLLQHNAMPHSIWQLGIQLVWFRYLCAFSIVLLASFKDRW